MFQYDQMKEKIVILTGAGISAESGIRTFRGEDGLWEGHRIEDVASPLGWEKDKQMVLDFYNARRAQLKEVQPNKAHQSISLLQEEYQVEVITQNVDDLHERAGNQNITHLHGELRKVRSCINSEYIIEWDDDLNQQHKCPDGSQLRPHIVWFGEAVPMIDQAINIISDAEYIWIIGTSMQVYPAASLVSYAPSSSKIYYIDPNPKINYELSFLDVQIIQDTAANATPDLVDEFMKKKNGRY